MTAGHVAGVQLENLPILLLHHWRSDHQVSPNAYPAPAWKFVSELIPRQHASDYVYSLEIMDRKEARRHWRESIKAAWNHRCAYCNGVPIHDASITLDHVHPRSRGGENLTSNLIPACAHCNSDKGSQDVWEWYRAQPFYSRMRELEIRAWLEQGNLLQEERWETLIPMFQQRSAA